MADEPFVLDRVENPHPRMLAAALELRRRAHLVGMAGAAADRWRGYLDAMCDATGETPEAIEAWLDRHTGG
jgi:malonyl CoA-acyl carrier protein transacylase